MTDREKLCELICESTNHDCGKYCNLSSASKCYSCTSVADHLLANGVTFAKDTNDGCKWISVEERLPEKDDCYLCCVKSSWFPGRYYVNILDYCKDGFKEGHIYTDSVTHWMSLPRPPLDTTNQAADL